MSIIAYTGSPNFPHLAGGAVPKGSQAFVKDTLVDRDTTNSYVAPSTSASTTVKLFGVFVDKSVTTAASPVNVDVIPLVSGPSQLWICDTTNATAANQLYKNQVLTDAATINNSSSNTAINTGVFVPIAIVGATTDNKLLGYFVVQHEINAAS